MLIMFVPIGFVVVISEVLNRDHVLEGHHLTVTLYFDCFGPVLPGMGSEPCWTPPAITVDFDPHIVQFVTQTAAKRSYIEGSLNDLCPGCTVTWPDSTTPDCGTVKISFSGATSMAISKRCRTQLTELLDTLEAGSVDILQEMWASFIERLKEQFADVNESVHIQLDQGKCCVLVSGERDKCFETISKLKCLQSELVDELQRSKERISESLSNISEHQVSLLQACGLLQTESVEELEVRVIDNVITLEGRPDKIIDRKMKIYQMLATAHSETVHVEDYVHLFLKQEPFRHHVDQLLEHITGVVWWTAGKAVEVYGEDKEKVSY